MAVSETAIVGLGLMLSLEVDMSVTNEKIWVQGAKTNLASQRSSSVT